MKTKNTVETIPKSNVNIIEGKTDTNTSPPILSEKPLRVKQYNAIQHYKTYIHEQHTEMSYIHS
jgi:hypothetical protein